jgi:hypothetical protein
MDTIKLDVTDLQVWARPLLVIFSVGTFSNLAPWLQFVQQL